MGPITKWYYEEIPKLEKHVDMYGDQKIYIIRTGENDVISGWYTTEKKADEAIAAAGIESIEPEPIMIMSVLDEMLTWIDSHPDE